jgi:hypothetical protein
LPEIQALNQTLFRDKRAEIFIQEVR